MVCVLYVGLIMNLLTTYSYIVLGPESFGLCVSGGGMFAYVLTIRSRTGWMGGVVCAQI